MALRGALTHRKTRRLGQALSIDACFALGLMESLWHVAGEQAIPNGGVGRMTDQDIAMEMFYTGDPTILVGAFLSSGLLDEHPTFRLIVHDWHVHSDDATDNKLARAGERYANGMKPRMRRLAKTEREMAERRYEVTVCDSVRTESHNTPPPVPEPVPEPIKEQKPSRAKRESRVHPLTGPVKKLVFEYYREKNQNADPPWNEAEGAHLKRMLSASPGNTLEDWDACLKGRALSEVNHADRPSLWLSKLTSFRNPVNAFNRPKEAQCKHVFFNALEQKRQREQGANA